MSSEKAVAITDPYFSQQMIIKLSRSLLPHNLQTTTADHVQSLSLLLVKSAVNPFLVLVGESDESILYRQIYKGYHVERL